MKRLLLALVLLFGAAGSAQAQGCGPSNPNCIVPTVSPCAIDNRAASTAYVNACGGGGGGVAQPFTTAPGTLTTNGQGTWGATVANGLVLGGQGSSFDLILQNKTAASVCNVATGTTTLNCTSLSVSGATTLSTPLAIAGGGTGAATQQAALNAVAPAPTRPGDFITWNGTNWVDFPGNNTGTQCLQENSSGVPTWTNCALLFTNVPDQVLTGGANVTSLPLTTGNVTIDCGLRPIQTITNGGAFTITAPSPGGGADSSSCLLKIINNATAGAITFSGFSIGNNTGDPLTTINGSKFTLFIWNAAGTSGYRVAAHQ